MASRIDMSAYSIVVWCSNCPTFSSGASDETEALSIANTHNKRENHKAATRLPRRRKAEPAEARELVGSAGSALDIESLTRASASVACVHAEDQ